ncbi:MAG: BPSS1780 family membrane protein [Burkholderiaceae bacterium]|nr:BPSS1780 family membrane protein [Burkholderiaceae bacterium]MDZ4162313.1 BPSS1780 family membrane protein [Burkholderiales bacterium]
MKLNNVPASTGWQWVKQGIRTFWKQPLAMSGLFFMFMGLVSVLSAVPFVGSALSLALLPAATLGLMAAARQAAAGKFPMPTVLASAFSAGKQRMHAMLKLGALYAVGFLLVMGLSSVFDGGEFAGVYLRGDPLTEEMAKDPDFQRALWVGMGLYLPLAIVFWHAPALVHWHGVEPVKSLFFSAMACWANKAALLVYAVCWLGVFMAGGMALSLLMALLGSPAVGSVLVLPAVLLMASMFFTSTYFTFADSFVAEPPNDTASTPPTND